MDTLSIETSPQRERFEMAKEVRAVVTVEAAPEEVWAVLTDFGGYAAWNPFMVEGAGNARVGSRLQLVMLNGTSRMRFRPTVTVVEPGRTLEWLGRLVLPGIFDGRHRFELTSTPKGTRVVQSERFSGVLVALMGRLERNTTENFERFNEALAARVLATRPVDRPAGQDVRGVDDE